MIREIKQDPYIKFYIKDNTTRIRDLNWVVVDLGLWFRERFLKHSLWRETDGLGSVKLRDSCLWRAPWHQQYCILTGGDWGTIPKCRQ